MLKEYSVTILFSSPKVIKKGQCGVVGNARSCFGHEATLIAIPRVVVRRDCDAEWQVPSGQQGLSCSGLLRSPGTPRTPAQLPGWPAGWLWTQTH